MKLFIKSQEDWIAFVNGTPVFAYQNPIGEYYKEILVAHNEIISVIGNVVEIIKRY